MTRQLYLRRLGALKKERSSWVTHWRELSDNVLPRRGRFLQSDRNRGDKKNASIINGTPTRAARILAAGMMAGITSPAREWFRLTVADAALRENSNVLAWLEEVATRMRVAFSRSNIYNALHSAYLDLGVFGSTAILLEEDAEDGLRAYVQPMGEYYLATSARLSVDTLYREVSLTVGQLAERFGLEACSPRVRESFRRGNVDEWVDVVHVVEPNRDYQKGKLGAAGKRWRSVWMEAVADEQHKGFLRQAGYEEFPVLAPRWDVTGVDIYGHSPGMDALGDCKALQHLERRKAQSFDKVTNPPMVGPASLQNTRVSLLPGDVTLVEGPQGAQAFRPAIEISHGALAEFRQAIAEHEQRINSAFYADLWLMLSGEERSGVTAREVQEKHEEKMLQLGPVLERLQDELLDPLIDWAFYALLRSGDLPEAPQELSGQPLRVEYISILAQAQKLLGTAAVERLFSFAGNLAAVRPDVLDKVDFDAGIDAYADMLGVPPQLVVPDEVVAEKRAAQAQAQAQAQQQEAAATNVQAAKTLSETDLQGDTALSRLVGALGGTAAGAAAVPE